MPTGTAVRPYVGGGVGALNLRRTIRDISRGNSRRDLAQFGAGDGVVDITSPTPRNRWPKWPPASEP